jgi:hypothetical protein
VRVVTLPPGKDPSAPKMMIIIIIIIIIKLIVAVVEVSASRVPPGAQTEYLPTNFH